jgi:hypothetical protein
MKLLALALGIVPLMGPGLALAQNGTMMNDGMAGGWMGGYGGAWVALLLVIVVCLVVWIAVQKRK